MRQRRAGPPTGSSGEARLQLGAVVASARPASLRVAARCRAACRTRRSVLISQIGSSVPASLDVPELAAMQQVQAFGTDRLRDLRGRRPRRAPRLCSDAPASEQRGRQQQTRRLLEPRLPRMPARSCKPSARPRAAMYQRSSGAASGERCQTLPVARVGPSAPNADRVARSRGASVGRLRTTAAACGLRHAVLEARRCSASVAGTRGPGRDDADQVQRIAGREPHDLAALRLAAHGAQRLDRLGRRELLADEAADEAPAAQLAAHLEAAVDAQQIAPRRRLRLARQQIAEHDAVAFDVLARQRLVARLLVSAPSARLGARRRAAATSARRRPRAAGAARPARVPARARAAAASASPRSARAGPRTRRR